MTKTVSLNTKCPHCGKALMDEDYKLQDVPSIKLNIETESNQRNHTVMLHLWLLRTCL